MRFSILLAIVVTTAGCSGGDSPVGRGGNHGRQFVPSPPLERAAVGSIAVQVDGGSPRLGGLG